MVVTMNTANFWLGLLGAVTVISSAGVLAYSDSSSTTAMGCIPCNI